MLELSEKEENNSKSDCEEMEEVVKNKRSKSLDKFNECNDNETDCENGDKSDNKRPETAPPHFIARKIEESLQKNLSNIKLNQDQSHPNELKTDKLANGVENDSNNRPTLTWHEHIYRKPPKNPTPHSINDILGWQISEKPNLTRTCDRITNELHCGEDRNNNHTTNIYQNVEASTLQHLLNLNMKSPESKEFYHQNYNSPTMPYSSDRKASAESPFNKGIANQNYYYKNGRSLSLSETSEDESVTSDQPLNLCVVKSRESSPAERRVDRCKKGQFKTLFHFKSYDKRVGTLSEVFQVSELSQIEVSDVLRWHLQVLPVFSLNTLRHFI